MKLSAKDVLEALGINPQAQGPQMAEARTGKIVRVADLKYLKESRGLKGSGIRISEGVAGVMEKLAPVMLQEGWDDWDSLADIAHEHYVEMGEATSASALGQLMRAGVQVFANNLYLRTAVSWPEYISEVASNKRQEFYAPLDQSLLPTQNRPQQPYKESKVTGQDIELINKKFMGGESFERELWDDDQTGQIRTRANALGKGQRLIEEIYVAGRMMGLTDYTIANFVVPASNWRGYNSLGTAISTPYATNLYDATHGNRPGSYAALNVITFKQGVAALMNALDQNGIKILVQPNHLVVSTQDAINTRTLVESDFWPAVQGLSGQQNNTATSGSLSGMGAKNVFKGLVSFSVNFYFKDWAWNLTEKKSEAAAFQRRDPMEIVQENPLSGASFEQDVMRYRSRSRWEFDYIDPRFFWLGNDGSVAGSQ